MSLNFQSAPPGGVSPTNLTSKNLQAKVIKLTSADFATGGTASVKAVLPKDVSIVGFSTWVKTQLAGGGITAATISVGVLGTPTKYASAVNAFGAAGTYAVFPNSSNIFQDAGVETGDQRLLITGTATTGNPTSGELYVLIEYVQ